MNYTISKLPEELYSMIGEYLSVIDFYHLTQTSSRLRQMFQFHLFRHCILFDPTFSEFECSYGEWALPVEVFLKPWKYSWFNASFVKTLRLSPYSQQIEKLVKQFPLREYQRLTKMDTQKTIFSKNVSSTKDGKRLKYLPVNKVMLNMSEFSKLPWAEEFPTLLYYDLLPVIKNKKKRSRTKKATNQEKGFRFFVVNFYALYCNTQEVLNSITSLELALKDVAPNNLSDISEYLESSLFSMDSYPNLESFKISSTSQSTQYDLLKRVVESLPRCRKLRKLEVWHEIFVGYDDDYQIVQLFDNLTGSWTYFRLGLPQSSAPYDQSMFFSSLNRPLLRIPNVDVLDATYDLLESYELECSNRLGKLHLSYRRNDLFENPCFNRLLDNLTMLSLEDLQCPLPQYGVSHVFNRPVPNLKKFVFKIFDGFLMRFYIKELFLDNFNTMLDKAPFGNFDIYNLDHVGWLLTENEQNCYHLANQYRLAVTANAERYSIDGIHEMYFQLMANWFDSKLRDPFFSTQLYATSRAFTSLLFLDILKYLPNLQTLEMRDFPGFDEYFALHKLVRYHPSIQNIMLDATGEDVLPKNVKDKYYQKVCKFTKISLERRISSCNPYPVTSHNIHLSLLKLEEKQILDKFDENDICLSSVLKKKNSEFCSYNFSNRVCSIYYTQSSAKGYFA